MVLYLPGATYIQVCLHVACLLTCGLLRPAAWGQGYCLRGALLCGRTSIPITMGTIVLCSQLPADRPVTMRWGGGDNQLKQLMSLSILINCHGYDYLVLYIVSIIGIFLFSPSDDKKQFYEDTLK